MSRSSRNNRRKGNIKLNYQRLSILIILILTAAGDVMADKHLIKQK